MNQKEIFDKLFILGFVWITPMSFVGILRSSLMWVLVNGVEVNIPICRNYDESVASNTSEEEEESTENQDQEEEEVQSKSQDQEEEEVQSKNQEEEEVQSKNQEEEESTLQKELTTVWSN